MEVFANVFAFMAGFPAMLGLVIAAAAIFLTSDWRTTLVSLLILYVLIGLALTRSIQAEVAVVKVLVGVMVVAMLYLSARRIQDMKGAREIDGAGMRFLGRHVAWGSGPLGLPLRLLAVLLAGLAVLRFAEGFQSLLPLPGANSPGIPSDVALVAFWLGGMGLLGLVLSGEPLRVAAAALTALAGFELIYAGLEQRLAVVGFWEAFVLLAALAFSYLIIVQGLAALPRRQDALAGSLAEALPEVVGQSEEGTEP
jgi:hypothetical protein